MRTKAPATASRVQERGINLDVPGAALARQAAERIAWHNGNAARIRSELSRLPAERPGEERPADDWKYSARRTELTRLMLGHEEYARFLTFVRQHLKRRHVYRLTLTDLAALEIMPKGSYQ
jgi:hypothetical protein